MQNKNMDKIQYRHMQTNKIVLHEEAWDYIRDYYGIPELEPKGQFGTLSLEQEQFISDTIDWFFSGEWYEEEIEDKCIGIG